MGFTFRARVVLDIGEHMNGVRAQLLSDEEVRMLHRWSPTGAPGLRKYQDSMCGACRLHHSSCMQCSIGV